MARYLKVLLGEKEDFMLVMADSKSVVQTAKDLHGLNPVACAALGRLLTGIKLMDLSLKESSSRISVTIDGGGEIGKLVAYAEKSGVLKGKVGNPNPKFAINDLGKLDVGFAVGKDGFVSVTRDSDDFKPYTGKSRIVSGEIAEDLARYYAESEQQPCAFALGVFVNSEANIGAAGGLMLHVLPDADEQELEKIEKAIAAMKQFSSYLLDSSDLKAIISHIFGNMPFKVIDEGEFEYACDCSKERAQRAFAAISADERRQIIFEDGAINLHCDYCGKDYAFLNAFSHE